jgi:hypothetical protein
MFRRGFGDIAIKVVKTRNGVNEHNLKTMSKDSPL